MADEKKASKPKRPTAKKRDMQNEKRRLQSRAFKSKVKTTIRSFEKDLSEKNEEGAKARLNVIYSLIDRGVKLGIYKLNKASRVKSQFSGRIQ